MDEITQSIYSEVIKSFKNISQAEKDFCLEGGHAYDIEFNLDIYEGDIGDIFYDMNWDRYPMEYFIQWLPYANQETRDWYESYVRYEKQKTTGNLDPDLDALTLEGADGDIKLNLLKYCKPIRDRIVQMCNDKTLYDPA